MVKGTSPKVKTNKGDGVWQTNASTGQTNQIQNIELPTSLRFKKRVYLANVLLLMLLVVSIFGLQVACVGSPHWLKLYDAYHQGIWKVCSSTANGVECFSHIVQPNYFKHIQIMMIVAIVLDAFSFTYLVFMMKRKLPGYILTLILACTATLLIVSLGLFTGRNIKSVVCSHVRFGWSYYAGWCSVFLTLVSAVIAIVIDRNA